MKILLPLLSLILLNSCGSQSESQVPDTADLSPAIQSVFSSMSPGTDALPIPEARANKQPGDSVVLEGRIMGVMKPFIDNRAAFVLGDNSVITPCSDMAEDHCATPWDACCDPNETRVDGTATVQIKDETGRVIRQGLEGVNGLAKLSSVKVFGTVDPASSPNTLIVNAETIDVLNP